MVAAKILALSVFLLALREKTGLDFL